MRLKSKLKKYHKGFRFAFSNVGIVANVSYINLETKDGKCDPEFAIDGYSLGAEFAIAGLCWKYVKTLERDRESKADIEEKYKILKQYIDNYGVKRNSSYFRIVVPSRLRSEYADFKDETYRIYNDCCSVLADELSIYRKWKSSSAAEQVKVDIHDMIEKA